MTQEERSEKIPRERADEIIQAINDHIEHQMLIRIERAQIADKENLEGFPLILSKDLLFMSHIVDFHDEGFVIIRTEDITDAYSRESISFYEEICVNEGLLERAKQEIINNVIDFTSVLKQLFTYEKFVIIQCEMEDNETYFSIGKIIDIDEKNVTFRNFDLMGIWEETQRIVPLNTITLIAFCDNYSSVFYKYVKLFSEEHNGDGLGQNRGRQNKDGSQ